VEILGEAQYVYLRKSSTLMNALSPSNRVLVVNPKPGLQELFLQAFQGPEGMIESTKNSGELCETSGFDAQRQSFSLWCVDSFHEAWASLADGKKDEWPYSLLFVCAEDGEWDIVREAVEKVWEYDDHVRCVCCLPSELSSWPAHLSLSRPGQWLVIRTPGRPEEILQLACCLCSPTLIDSSAETHPLTGSGHISHMEAEVKGEKDDALSSRDENATRGAIQGSKLYVDNILRSMADALLVINAELTISAVNPSMLQLLGYDENELIGQSPGSIFGEEFARGSIIENLLLQGSVSGVESSLLTKTGKEIPISVSGSMMQDEQGQFQGLVCVAQDITERKRMEEEKRELHEQLLDASRQLGMAEVASDVLHNVGNVLNSINVSIGVMTDLVKQSLVGDVGRVSQLFQKHQANLGSYFMDNPKGKQIPAFLEKLSGQLMEEKRVALLELERLRENAQHAQQCVAAQQDLAKPSNITEPLCIADLCEEALAVHHKTFESSHIDVVREFQEMPLVIVDKHLVLKILVDVLNNACQAMELVDRKQLVIRANLIPGPPDSVCIEVQDSGVGIASEDLIKIFGQVNSPKHGGRGLSLHTGALMAKNIQGSLRAHSPGLGQGATFSLALPGNFHFPEM